MSARKKACVLTHGCPESRIDSAKVQVFLQKNSYAITRKVKEADLILFRTCGLTKRSEDNSACMHVARNGFGGFVES